MLGYKLVLAKAGSRMPHQHVPVANGHEATGGVSEATRPILPRGACSLWLLSLARARESRSPAGATPTGKSAVEQRRSSCRDPAMVVVMLDDQIKKVQKKKL